MSMWILILLLFVDFTDCKNITVAIIGTNDIHGAALPALLKRQDTGEKYWYGGMQYMGRLINIIKSEHEGNLVYLDAGDQFQGGIESSKIISSGKIMNDFYGLLGLDGSAIGNHEFDFGPSFLFPFMEAKDGPNLAANLRNQNGKADFMPGQKSSKMFEFASGIKIGVIGLATLETPSTTAGFSQHKFPAYKFLAYKKIVIDQAAKLRRKGADAVLIVSHVGNQCFADFTYKIWTKDSEQIGCNQNDEITVLLKSLPKGTVQGVVQGHRHTVSHIFVDEIPVMGNINGGYYFNVMYLTFNWKKTVVDAKIEGPIPVCQKIFKNTGTCHYMKPSELVNAGELVNWKFHNQDVYAEPRVQTVYEQEWLPLMKDYMVQLVENQVYLFSQRNQECELANLITNLVHANFTTADFVMLNPGGFRTQWLPGIIEQQHFYNMFPFDNQFVSFAITGKELLETLSIMQSGKKGFYQFWGIQTTVKVQDNQHVFVSAKMADGSDIDEAKNYTGVTTDFMINGGDDFATVLQKGVYVPRDVSKLGEFRSSIRGLLSDMKVIKEGTLIDPDHPRIIVLS